MNVTKSTICFPEHAGDGKAASTSQFLVGNVMDWRSEKKNYKYGVVI